MLVLIPSAGRELGKSCLNALPIQHGAQFLQVNDGLAISNFTDGGKSWEAGCLDILNLAYQSLRFGRVWPGKNPPAPAMLNNDGPVVTTVPQDP
jgi:hypothetical protein